MKVIRKRVSVAERLRKNGLRGARIIALTGYGQKSDRQRSREAGFDAHVTKPIGAETLRVVMNQ